MPSAAGIRCHDLRRLVSHGEESGVLSEIVGFSRRAWTAQFANAGWRVMQSRPLGNFYAGYMLLAGRLGLGARA